MIRSLRLENFRSHADTQLSLRPLSLLVGPAGAGKSNIFKGLVFIQNTVHRPAPELFPPGLGEFHWVRSRWAGETDPIGFEVELDGLPNFPNEHGSYTLRFADSPAGIYVLEETLKRKAGSEEWQWVFQRRRGKSAQMGEFGTVEPYDPTVLHKVWHDAGVKKNFPTVQFAKEFARSLSQTGYYHLEVSNLKSTGRAQVNDSIGYYGDGLPEFFAWAKAQQDTIIYERIRDEMRELLPDLEEILVTHLSEDRQGIAMSFKGHRGYIAARELSDGTMLTLGLLCIIHGPRKPQLLCIEEPETGLHPRRLRWLFDRLASLAFPKSGQPVQVLLTTHAPYFVDLFKDMQDAVQIVEQREGRTKVTALLDVKAKIKSEGTGDPIGHEWATGLFEGL